VQAGKLNGMVPFLYLALPNFRSLHAQLSKVFAEFVERAIALIESAERTDRSRHERNRRSAIDRFRCQLHRILSPISSVSNSISTVPAMKSHSPPA
jgi:hypothetical protein